MYAIIKTGGKQYKVAEGEEIRVEKLNVEDGKKVKFEEVLLVSDGKTTKVGTPVVDGAAVEGTVTKNGRGKKIRVFKFKPKNNGYKRTMGHRQPYTAVKIEKIVM